MSKQNTSFWVTRDPRKGSRLADMWRLEDEPSLGREFWVGPPNDVPMATVCLKFFTASTGIKLKPGKKLKVQLTAEVLG